MPTLLGAVLSSLCDLTHLILMEMGTLTDPSFIDGETETQGNEVNYRPTAYKQWTGM